MAIMLEFHRKFPFRSASDLCVFHFDRQNKNCTFLVDYNKPGRFLGVSE